MAEFNLEAFRANFKGGARSYLFYYIPNFPSGVSGMTADEVTYLVRTTSLPESTLEETIVNWQGYDFKFAAKHTFTDFTITFNVDRGAKVRKLFEDWIELIHNSETNVYAPLDTYMADQTVSLLDYDGSSVMKVKLYNAWVKTVGPITLDYAATDTAQFDVTFTYSHHKIDP